MDSHNFSRAEVVARGILGCQILSVPFACALSSISVVLASRFLSKTSTRRPAQRRYFEYQAGASRPLRMVLARAGAVLVAAVCVMITIMELVIVYQTAVNHPDEKKYRFVPWTSSLVPLLTSIVSLATQSYFSDKILHNVQKPKLVFPFLAILGIGSLAIGSAATIALLIKPFQGPTVGGVTVSEAFFWAYLIITTVSSCFLSFHLVGLFLKERRVILMEARRAGQSGLGPSRTTWILRFFLSTYTLVLILDILCLITSIVSAAPNFDVAFNASKAFLVLQKLMVRVMAISYLYALLDGIPKNPIFSPPNEAQLKALYTTPQDRGFKAPRAEFNPQRLSKSKLKSLQNSVNRALSKYESDKDDKGQTIATAGEPDEGEIFSYSYPPHSANSINPPAKTPTAPDFRYNWEPIKNGADNPPTPSKKTQRSLAPGPTWSPLHSHQSQFPPSLPLMPPQFRENLPLPALPRGKF